MHRRETERLLAAIRQAQAASERVALATVVRVRGSAYRREGTRMLVRRNGTYECGLSGGCLEPSVAEAALHVIATGEPAIVSYDLADDSLWGLGMGCSGAVDIRIERLEDDAVSHEWLAALERGDAAVLATPLSGVSGRLLVRAGGEIAGGLTDSGIEREAIGRARDHLRSPFPAPGPRQIGGSEIFFEISTPPPELVIFGAGPDVAPLAQQAWALGFAVTVVDVRDAYLTADRFPGATLVSAHFSQFAGTVLLRPGSFVLVMNHHVERDQESLRFALESDAAYIGVLGPRSQIRQASGRPRRPGLGAAGGEPLARAQPGGALARRGNAGRSRDVHSRRDPRDSTRLRGRLPERLGQQPSPSGRQPALGQLVVFRRIDIHQQIGRKMQHRRPVAVPLEHRTGPVLQLRELGEEFPLEQMRRRHDLAVPDADDCRRLRAVGVEHRPVLGGGDKRLIREREHRGRAVGQMLDRGAE